MGKSALLNCLARRTVSIVHDQPGVTRDRIAASVERDGRHFELVDTGGIGMFETEVTPKEIADAVQLQVQVAIETADLVLIVTDGIEGLRPLDEEIVSKLRRSKKKLWLLVNKLDIPKHESRAAEFYKLGIEPLFPVSASHACGIGELWEALEREAGDKVPGGGLGDANDFAALPKLAVVGRPNVGKSSLVNRLLGAERVIVSEIPGTTRDSVELGVEFSGKHYCLIDTAGIRNKSRIRTNVEMYSRHWTEKSIAKADIVLLMLSAPEGPTRQDREIAGMIAEHQKPCMLLVNKWDLNEKLETRRSMVGGEEKIRRQMRRTVSRSEYEGYLRKVMPFLDYAPVMFVSALEGYYALKIWREIGMVAAACKTVFTTGVLNRIIARVQERVQPPMKQGRRLKIYYATQRLSAQTPTFMMFINHRDLWVESYGRYLASQLREENPLTGCPIVFQLREKQRDPAPGASSRRGGRELPE